MKFSQLRTFAYCTLVLGGSATIASACWTVVPGQQRCGDPDSGGSLICDEVEYPLWRVHPGIINVCTAITNPGGWGQTDCTNEGTQVWAQLCYYDCDLDGFPIVTNCDNYGVPCLTAQLTGGNCRGSTQ